MNAGAENPEGIKKSCRKFVQQFYSWYVPGVEQRSRQNTETVLKQRFLSPELFRDLKIDWDARAAGLWGKRRAGFDFL